MPIRLHNSAFQYAKRRIKAGQIEHDDRDIWADHQPSPADEDQFIRDHGLEAYAKWYLGINDSQHDLTKSRYTFPIGDFQKVHRCAVLVAQTEAAATRHPDIESAASQLLSLIDAHHPELAH